LFLGTLRHRTFVCRKWVWEHTAPLTMLPTAYFEVLEVLPAAWKRADNTQIVGMYLKHVRLPP
jgi:hypothetical protein